MRLARCALVLMIVLVALLTASCRGDPNEMFIQGTWYNNDEHLKQVVGESPLETWWTFDRGAYELSACCFVKTSETGRYEILKSEGDSLTLGLFNRNGDVSGSRAQIKIVIDREAETLRIQRAGPFERVGP
ncbi:MAG: hypothetical protein P8X95_08670 [Anaerolineales bacterium]|jgi:hypothetical protein